MSLLVLILTYFLIFYFHRLWVTYGYWKKRGVVGPTPWPIVGNYGPVLFRLKEEKQLIQEIYDKYSKERYVGLFIGTRPTLLIRDPNIVKKVLVTDFEKFPDRFISAGAGNYRKGLFTAFGGDYWRALRKIISQFTNTTTAARFIPQIETASEKYTKFVAQVIKDNEEQNILDLKGQYIIRLVHTVFLGVDMEDENINLSKVCNKVVRLETNEMMRIVEYIFPIMLVLCKPMTNWFVAKLKNYFDHLLTIAVKQKHNELAFNNEPRTYFNFFLDLKEKFKKSNSITFDDDVFIQNMSNFIIATMHTVKTTMAYAAYRLATNPDIQEKCYEEIVRVLDKHNGKYHRDSLLEMKYLKMVLNESLRLHIQTYIIDRICGSKHNFCGLNITIDKGVLVYIPVDCLHMDAKYFPEPEKFIPERFAENRDKITPCTFLPFGEGPRNCIGKQLTAVMMMVGMAVFLKNFQLLPSEHTPQKLRYSSSLRIKNLDDELRLNIRRRNGNNIY